MSIAVAALVLVAVVAFLVLRGGAEEPVAVPTPTPTPTPTPSPTPVVHPPVAGSVETETIVVSSGPIMFRAADDRSVAPSTDTDAVADFVDTIADWLDRHLTSLQDEEGSLLEEVAVEGSLDDADDATTAGLSDDLASHGNPVEEAGYHLVVAAEGGPLWAHVRVDITRQDGDRRSAEFVFTAGDATPQLVAAAVVDPDTPAFSGLAPPEEGRH